MRARRAKPLNLLHAVEDRGGQCAIIEDTWDEGMADRSAAEENGQENVLEGLEVTLDPGSLAETPLATGGFGSVHRARFVIHDSPTNRRTHVHKPTRTYPIPSHPDILASKWW